ncbi:sodium:solute symporter family protein [Desulfallas sp. Bu1-1]|uniref:sodium:solute symporter family protein n=1 Tax=Desulfallas sp. Bu1-1 TaxID=2787620 RepID=UPI0018A00346|nr:sodium:solute symporter family protein [Desulfallas sp. Bu1-1]MBF7084470.1 sodium:solute symporter family protein [Desulfallas sp. Bu1-1]
MSVEFVIVTLYMVASLGIGYWVMKSQSGAEGMSQDDFFLAGRGLSWLPLTFTVAGTYFSTYAMMGVAGALFKQGIPWITVCVSTPIVVSLVMWHIGRRIWYVGNKNGYITPADLLDDYFNSKTLRVLTALTNIAYCIPYVTIQIIGGAKILEMVSGGAIPFSIGAWIILFVILAYVMMGGMAAVAWTDVIQGILLLGGMYVGGLYAGYYMFNHPTDLWARAIQEIPQHLTMPGALGNLTWIGIFSTSLMIALGQVPGGAPFWMRCYASGGLKSLKISAGLQPALLSLAYLFATTLVGIGGRIIWPDIANPDNLFLQLMSTYAPPVIIGGVFAAIIAAGMSTADSNLHAISSVLSVDIYKKFINPNATEKQVVWVGRIIILVMGLASLWVSMNWSGMIVPLAFIAMSMGMQLAPPLLAALFWKRASTMGAICGLVSGLVVTYLTLYVWPNPLTIHGGFWGFMVNAAVLVVVSLFDKPRPQEVINRFQMNASA